MKTKRLDRNKRVMLQRKIAESRRTFGAGRRLLSAAPEFAPRLLRIALVGLAGAGAAYLLQRWLLDWLFQPVGDQLFAYTSYGQLGLLWNLYIAVGLVVAVPLAAYHVLKAMETRFVRVTSTYFLGLGLVSAALGAAGIYFGYHYGLPQAMPFLAQQFLPNPAEPLAAVMDYVQFASLYLLLSALAFQIPLIVYVANQLKVRRVRSYLSRERPVLLASLLVAAALNPSDDVLAMFVIALPLALMYQAGIFTAWCMNRLNSAEAAVARELLHTDAATRAERLQQLEAALLAPVLEPIPVAMPDSDPEMPEAALPTADDTYAPRPQSAAGTAAYAVPAPPAPPAPSGVDPAPVEVPGRHHKPPVVNGIRRRLY